MKQIRTIACLSLALAIGYSTAQAQTPISFFPHAAGNVWQYRDATTNEIVYTRYNDSVWTDSAASILIAGRRTPGQNLFEKIDTSLNVFNLVFQPDYPRYKLPANIGDSWVAGILTPNDTAVVTVTNVYQGYVFGVSTTIKVFTFEIRRPPPDPPFWLGEDHMASAFGLVYSLIEGGSAPYLAGAIIDSVLWGQIVSVKEQRSLPNEFALLPNYPNPFNPATTFRFTVPAEGRVQLTVNDILGRLVAALLDDVRQAGT